MKPRSLLVGVGLGLVLFLLSVGGLLWMLLAQLMDMARRDVWVLAAVLFAFAMAVALYAVGLTRRLRLLAREVEAYRASGFSRRPNLQKPAAHNDELGSLARTLETMAERMTQQLERIQREDQARRELVANVSHDLRTPLAAMRGYLDTLLIKGDSLDFAQRKSYLGIAVEQANRLAHLIGELFEMAKLDVPNATVYAEPCVLAELIQDVTQKFALLAEAKEIQILLDVELVSSRVCADIALMERVLSNLLDNALRHTPKGGSVKISLKPRDGNARVEVRDSGAGIDIINQARIFERFYQADASRSRGGAGLGLSIVRRVLELHGSEIKLTSTLGLGACFYFELPLMGEGRTS